MLVQVDPQAKDKKLTGIALRYMRRRGIFGLMSFALFLLPFVVYTGAQGANQFSKLLIGADDALAQALSATQYGAAAVVGEPLEPCATQTTIPGAKVLTPTDNWQTTLQTAAPGTTILLHGGIYAATQKLNVSAGQPGLPVTVKPYNCEAVTLRGSFTPLSNSVMAGLRIEGTGLPVANLTYVIRIDAKNKGALRNVVIRNNTIVGGETDALRINDDVVGVTLTGNHIDGGKGGHDLFVTTETTPIDPAKSPDNIVITNNRLTKVYFRSTALPSEDMFQVRDARHVTFAHNTCTTGSRMEQCVDIKAMTAPLIMQYNWLDGANLHLDGPGEDGSAGCMVIHETDGHPENHLIEYNYFKNCRDTVIRFASEGGAANSSGTVRYNVFLNPDVTDADALLVWRAQDVVFENNTLIRGTLKLGRGNGLSQNPPITPKNTVLKHNIFYQTRIDDNTQAPNFGYTCSYNLLFGVTEHGNQPLNCVQSLTTDPLLISLATEDYAPRIGSPACGSGENGVDRGALPCTNGPATNTPTFTPTKTPAPTATNPPKSTPTQTPTPTVSTKGSVSGKLKNSQGAPVKNVNVTVYQQSGSGWKSVTSVKTSSAGDYLVNNLAIGIYRVRFSASTYITQYYDKATAIGTATNVQINANLVTTGINAVLTNAAANMARAASMGNFNGQISDAATGAPIADATITLYTVPNWRPRNDAGDTADATCESLQAKAPEAAWSQFAPTDLGEWFSTEMDAAVTESQIRAMDNPQQTDSNGHYTWNITPGCWYVEVEAEGYAAAVSPVVGISSTVGDLNLVLTPLHNIYLPVIGR